MSKRGPASRPVAGRLLLVAALITSGVAIACSEDVPTSPVAKVKNPDPSQSSVVAALSCRGDVEKMTVTCGAPSASSESDTDASGVPDAQNIIIGGQDVFVAVKSTNVNYNSGTGAFTFDVTIRNLIPQPLGTADTTGAEAPDPAGVRIFFAAGPLVTGGTGLITVSGDGTDTFTGANQPYYQYNTVLSQFEISAPKTWQLNMPPTVTTFDFLLLVSAAVPRPDGFIDLQLSSLKPPTDRQTTATVRNANGTIDGFPGTITWSVSDTTRATIDANGLVNPLRAGSVTIIAQQGLRIGYLTVIVQPIRRVWLGTTNTDWSTGTNWSPDGIKPEPTDTAVVTDSVGASVFPTLVQNESVAGVEVTDVTPGGVIPTVSLGAFNLTASGDVETTNSSSITNTSGQLLLTGIARTLRGTLPPIRVSGTYSLIGNVTARAPIRVDLGRLTANGFRLQGQGF
jgi:hypothetical protein